MYAVENMPPYVKFHGLLAENDPSPRAGWSDAYASFSLYRILFDIMLHTTLLFSSFAPHVGNDVAPMGVLLLCAG